MLGSCQRLRVACASMLMHWPETRYVNVLGPSLQSITKRKIKEASLSLSVKAGLPASIENLNGTWVKVSGMTAHMRPHWNGVACSRVHRSCLNSHGGGVVTLIETSINVKLVPLQCKPKRIMNISCHDRSAHILFGAANASARQSELMVHDHAEILYAC